MTIQPVNNNVIIPRKAKINPVSATGYGALAFGTLSVIAAVNKKMKSHKNLGYLAGALAFIHTGIVLGKRMVGKNTPDVKESNS